MGCLGCIIRYGNFYCLMFLWICSFSFLAAFAIWAGIAVKRPVARQGIQLPNSVICIQMHNLDIILLFDALSNVIPMKYWCMYIHNGLFTCVSGCVSFILWRVTLSRWWNSRGWTLTTSSRHTQSNAVKPMTHFVHYLVSDVTGSDLQSLDCLTHESAATRTWL